MAGEVFTNRLHVLLKQSISPILMKQFQETCKFLELVTAGTPQTITPLGFEFDFNVVAGGHNKYGDEGDYWNEHLPPIDIKARVKYARMLRAVSMSYDTYCMLKNLPSDKIIEDYGGRLMRDMKTALKDHEQHLWGDGSGEVARVGTTPAAGTFTNVTVTFASTVAGGNTFGVYKVRVGAYYNFFTSAGVQRTNGSVTRSKCLSVNLSAGTAVFDVIPNDATDPTVVATDRLIPDGSFGRVPYGMAYFHLTTGEVQNLMVDTYPQIRPTAINAGNRILTGPILTKLKFAASYRFDDQSYEQIKYLYSPAQAYQLNLVGQSLRTAVMNDRTYDPGYTKLQFEQRDFMEFPDIQRDRVYAFAPGMIKQVEWHPYGPVEAADENGVGLPAIKWRNTASGLGTAAILDTHMYWGGNFYCDDPHSLQYIYGLDYSNAPVGTEY